MVAKLPERSPWQHTANVAARAIMCSMVRDTARRIDFTELGQLGLAGWRKRVVDRVADPVSSRTPLTSDQLRAVIGGVLFGLAVYYVLSTTKKAAQQVRAASPGTLPLRPTTA